MPCISIRAGFVALLIPVLVGCSAAGSASSSDPDDNASTGDPGGAGGGGASGSAASTTGDFNPSTSAASGAGGAGGGAPSCVTGGGGFMSQPDEICGNGKDENGNGFIDESCSCQVGETQACYPGTADLCDCQAGTQACKQSGEFGQWGPCEGVMHVCIGPLDATCEICGNGVDDDCDGMSDEDCVLDVQVNINGDCLTASCPPQAPYPIGCNINMAGNDERGCVANTPGSSVVYFQEGDSCGAGKVTGTLTCSSKQGPPLDQNNCPMNKQDKFYPSSKDGCPDT